MFDLEQYVWDQIQWSTKTFGPGPRTGGITKHIEKELGEIRADPASLEEWIDVVILALDGAWRAGHQPDRIVMALIAKQAKNFKRTYPLPVSQDEPSEHVRS